jgi:hypothetical protein
MLARAGVDLLPGVDDGTDTGTGEAPGLPAGFEPASVVECRLDAAVPLRPGESATIDPETGAVSKPPGGPVNGIPAEFDRVVVRVTAVRLEGDLAPLLAVLARQDEQARADQACPLPFIVKPQVYLVDARGGAVRVRWPTDACGFLFAGASDPLGELTAVGSTTSVRSLG